MLALQTCSKIAFPLGEGKKKKKHVLEQFEVVWRKIYM